MCNVATGTQPSMPMPMMDVRVMRVRMNQVRVPVPVRMRLAGRFVWAVRVLMMLVVMV